MPGVLGERWWSQQLITAGWGWSAKARGFSRAPSFEDLTRDAVDLHPTHRRQQKQRGLKVALALPPLKDGPQSKFC